MGLFLEKEDREGHRPAGRYRPSGRTRHDEEEGPSLHGRPRAPAAGQRPPCPAIFFQISLSGMPQARATPAP